MKQLILASASPRRAELLQQIGLTFLVKPSSYVEDFSKHSTEPAQLAVGLAVGKVIEIAETLSAGLVIGADTIVVSGGEVLGKPIDSADAIRMLTGLSGKEHLVYTGLVVCEVPENRLVTDFAVTKVKFRELSRAEVEAYVATGEPLDKAGAYGIQGRGAVLVEKIDGCYFNVVGLPINKLVILLQQFGVSVW